MDRWSNMAWSFSQGFKLNPNQSSLWLSLVRVLGAGILE